MESLVEKGMVKAIGMSNFSITKTERILKTAKIPPALLQMECHPYCQQTKLKDYCDSKGQPTMGSVCFLLRLNFDCNNHWLEFSSQIATAIALGIVLQAHSPLGNPTRPPHYNDPNDPIVMEDPVVLDIAKKYSVHPALVSDTGCYFPIVFWHYNNTLLVQGLKWEYY